MWYPGQCKRKRRSEQEFIGRRAGCGARHSSPVILVLLVLIISGSVSENVRAQDQTNEVFLKAFYPLDEPRFHCVDIPGHRQRVNVERPLSVHTCKEGIWHRDEIFDLSGVADGLLRMPEYDLCLAAEARDTGAKIVLKPCGNSELGKWNYENYRIKLSGHPDMCLTIGPDASELTPGGRRLPSKHTARSLALDNCSDQAMERQLWRFEKPQKREGSILPFNE